MNGAHCFSGLATLGLIVSLMSCTVITDVDRSLIDSDGGAAGAAPTVQARGALDGYRDGQVFGWAVVGDGSEPATVRVEVDGEVVARAVADEDRPDLVDAGVSATGIGGFHADVGELDPDAEVRVFIDGLGVELRGSPLTVE